MVLVDTSIWISHFRRGKPALRELLVEGSVFCHPFVIGELACGNLGNRREILSLLKTLPQPPHAGHDEVLLFIERNSLMGSGLGWLDAHLLASALLGSARLWTVDKSLQKASAQLDILYDR